MTKDKHNGHQTETPDVSHIRNVEVTHETSDINVMAVLQFVAALTIITVAIFFGMLGLFRFLAKEAQEPPPGPMALTKDERLPPVPRLQGARGFEVTLEDGQKVPLELSAPDAEYKVLHEQWQKALRGELKDQGGNPVFIPIEQAIDKLVTSGVRAKPAEGSDKLEDFAISAPTAASSGRVSEKRISGKK
jgi:hypothetical protein